MLHADDTGETGTPDAFEELDGELVLLPVLEETFSHPYRPPRSPLAKGTEPAHRAAAPGVPVAETSLGPEYVATNGNARDGAVQPRANDQRFEARSLAHQGYEQYDERVRLDSNERGEAHEIGEGCKPVLLPVLAHQQKTDGVRLIEEHL